MTLPGRAALADCIAFLKADSHILLRAPSLFFQQAANRPENTFPARAARERWEGGFERRPWLRLLNKRQGDERCQLTIDTGSPVRWLFFLDRHRIVSASPMTIEVWDVETGRELKSLTDYVAPITSCAVSPAGTEILTAHQDGTLRIWNLDTSARLACFEGFGDEVSTCAYAPDGRRIVSGFADGTVRVWNVENPSGAMVLTGHQDAVTDCACSPDGRQILSASKDSTVKIWDAETGELIDSLVNHRHGAWACTYSHDGTKILSGAGDGTVRVSGAATGDVMAELRGPGRARALQPRSVKALMPSPDGRWIVVMSSGERSLYVFDAERGVGPGTLPTPEAERRHSQVTSLGPHGSFLNCCAYSPGGDRIASGSEDGTIKIWTAGDWRSQAQGMSHSFPISDCTFTPDLRLILSSSWDLTLSAWDVASGEELGRIPAGGGGLACSPDQRRLVGASGTLKVWNIADTWCEIASLSGQDVCAFSPDGSCLASGGSDQSLRLWDAISWREIAALKGHRGPVESCSFSPDGRRIVSGSVDETLRLWDFRRQHVTATLSGHRGRVTCCSFSPDGLKIASASWDETVKVWDARSGQELATFGPVSMSVNVCRWTPDGRFVAAGVGELARPGAITVWDAATGERVLAFHSAGDVLALGVGSGRCWLVAGDERGILSVFQPMGLALGVPLVTAVRLIGAGEAREPPTFRCPWCGQRLAVPDAVLDTVASLTAEGNPSPQEPPSTSLPLEAWDRPGLWSKCERCREPLKFNPYVAGDM